MILSWRLPLLESELSNKLKSIRMVVVSKDHNHSQRPKIAVKQGSEIIRRFQLPPKPQYILINVKSALKYQQVPMKKEISFTLHGRFIVSWNTRKNISNNWQFDGKICKQLGGVHKLRLQDFGFFWPPTPLRLHFLWYERLQKVDIFGPPTYLVL